MNAFSNILNTIGSIVVFMIGFQLVSDSVQSRLSPWIKKVLKIRETDRFRGFFKGFIATVPVGSSSSIIVFLLSMVNSGLVSLKKTPLLLLGINLGATVAGWLIALAGYYLELTGIALVLLAVALPFKISSFLSEYTYGDALTGVGLVLLGIELLNNNLPHAHLMYMADTPYGVLGAFILGVLISLLIRSSIGTLVLAMSLGFSGWLVLELCAAMVLGSNLGRTIIGSLAGRNLGIEARRTAFVHLMLNLGACLWGGVFFFGVLELVELCMPGSGYVSSAIPFRLAFFHSFIHTVNPVFMLPLIPFLLKVSERVVGKGKRGKKILTFLALSPLPGNLPDSLDSNIILMQSGLVRMADRAYEMLMLIMNASQSEEDTEETNERIEEIKLALDTLEYELSIMFTESVRQPCSRIQAEKIWHQQRVAYELKKIGDACYKSMLMLNKSRRKQYRFHGESRDELFEFISQVLDFLRYIIDYLEDNIKIPDLELAKKMEDSIDKMRNRLKKRAGKVMEQNRDAHIRGELAFIEIVGYLEHIGDSCLSISETIPQIKTVKGIEK